MNDPATPLARLVTTATSPTLLMAVLSPLVGGLAVGTVAGVLWGLLGVVFIAAIPAGIVHAGVVTGRYTDHHLSRREQRAVPLTLAAISVVVGVVLLVVLDAPRVIVALQVAVLVVLLSATAITLAWKISFHVAVVAASAMALTLAGGGWWVASWLAVPAAGWARLRLSAHTPAQVVAGGVLGGALTLVVLLAGGV